MRRLVRSIGNAAIAIAVAASMFANVQIGASAADYTMPGGMEGMEDMWNMGDLDDLAKDNPMAARLKRKMIEYMILSSTGGEIKDTVVIDFSERRQQSYEGPQLGTDELDDVMEMDLDQDAKNVIFINVLRYYNKFFETENDGDEYSGNGRIIIDRDKNQYIDFTMSNGGGKTTFDAGESKGTYKVHVTPELLRAQGSAEEDVEMAMCGAICMYDVLGAFDQEYDIEIRFGGEEPVVEESGETDPGKQDPQPENPGTTEPGKEDPQPENPGTTEPGKEDPQPENPGTQEPGKDEPVAEEPGTQEPAKEEPKTEETPSEVTPAPVNSDDKNEAAPAKDDKKAETAATVAIGTEFSDNGYTYKVTAADEVAFTGPQNKALKAVKIADTASYQGVTFKVTAVADKALAGNKKVTSVTVGANVKTIGASAFAKCKKLKKVTINATNLEKIGKKAFNKNSKKLVVKIHKSNFKAYKKLFKKAKLTSVKLKKIK